MNEQRLGAAALVMAGIGSIQLGAAVATELFEDVGPAGAVFLRTIIAAAVLIAIWRPLRGSLQGEARRDVVLFGCVLAGMNLCFFLALNLLPLGVAVTFEFVGPLTVAIVGSRRRLDLLWVGFAVAGLLLFAPGIGDGLDPLGVALALTAGGFWGLYILLSARVGRGASGRGGLAVAMCVATVLLLPVGVAAAGTTLLEPRALALGAVVAVLSSAIPYLVELEALRRLRAATFGVLLSMEPAVAALVGLLVLGQALPARELAAIALIVVASAGALSTAPSLEGSDAVGDPDAGGELPLPL